MIDLVLYGILYLAAGMFFLAAFSREYRATGAIMAASFIINIALYNRLDALTSGNEIDHLIKAVLIVGLNYTTISCLLISSYKFKGTTQITQSLILGAFILIQFLADVNVEGLIWQNFEYILLGLYLITGLSILRGTVNGARDIKCMVWGSGPGNSKRHLARSGVGFSRGIGGGELFPNNHEPQLATVESRKESMANKLNSQDFGMGEN